MQASKIIPGTTYAFKRDDKLLRFRVTEVVTVTRRRGAKNNPHDHESEVHGTVETDPKIVKAAPERLLGEYQEYSELVARQEQERAAAQRKTEEEKNNAHQLAQALYRLVKLPMPANLDGYNIPFTTRYGTLQIEKDGVVPLLTALKHQQEEIT